MEVKIDTFRYLSDYVQIIFPAVLISDMIQKCPFLSFGFDLDFPNQLYVKGKYRY